MQPDLLHPSGGAQPAQLYLSLDVRDLDLRRFDLGLHENHHGFEPALQHLKVEPNARQVTFLHGPDAHALLHRRQFGGGCLELGTQRDRALGKGERLGVECVRVQLLLTRLLLLRKLLLLWLLLRLMLLLRKLLLLLPRRLLLLRWLLLLRPLLPDDLLAPVQRLPCFSEAPRRHAARVARVRIAYASFAGRSIRCGCIRTRFPDRIGNCGTRLRR